MARIVIEKNNFILPAVLSLLFTTLIYTFSTSITVVNQRDLLSINVVKVRESSSLCYKQFGLLKER